MSSLALANATPAESAARIALMKSCLSSHLDAARAKRKRFAMAALTVAIAPSAVLGALAGSAVLGLASLVLLGVLLAPLPLVVQYADIGRVTAFERAFDADPHIVTSVVDLQLRVNGTHVRRATISTATGASFGLMLPPERIAALVAAFPPTEDFDALLAKVRS